MARTPATSQNLPSTWANELQTTQAAQVHTVHHKLDMVTACQLEHVTPELVTTG